MRIKRINFILDHKLMSLLFKGQLDLNLFLDIPIGMNLRQKTKSGGVAQ